MTQETVDLAKKLVSTSWWEWACYVGMRAVWGCPAKARDGYPSLASGRVTGVAQYNADGECPSWALASVEEGWVSDQDIPDLDDNPTVSILNRLAGTKDLDGPTVAQYLLQKGIE